MISKVRAAELLPSSPITKATLRWSDLHHSDVWKVEKVHSCSINVPYFIAKTAGKNIICVAVQLMNNCSSNSSHSRNCDSNDTNSNRTSCSDGSSGSANSSTCKTLPEGCLSNDYDEEEDGDAYVAMTLTTMMAAMIMTTMMKVWP